MTQEPSTPAGAGAARSHRDSPRLLLVDGLEAPRRALAGHLATHLGAPRITESRSLAETLAHCRDPAQPRWDAVLISAGDSAEARSAVARLRADLPDVPVLVMRPSGTDPETEAWPDGVALVDRPVRLSTLAATLRSLLGHVDPRERPAEEAADAAGPDPFSKEGTREGFALGPYQCDPPGRTLTDRASGRTIRLTEKEAAILACLHNATVPVSRDDLLSRVWGYATGVASHTLETHIHRLRRKIEVDPRQPALLLKDSAGYRLVR